MSRNDFVRAAARVGSIVRNKYRIDRVIAVGGMAIVYEATHRNRKRFALKMLRPELAQRGDARTRFVREGYVANTVEHPGAVSVLDDDVAEDGTPYLVMELLDGRSLDTFGDIALPLPVALGITYGLLDVLAAAHAKGIVHRDIKPGNVLLCNDGHVKVLDFGIARLRTSEHQTATGVSIVLGTPGFMSPEQASASHDQIGPTTDVWGVGALLFLMVSGRPLQSQKDPMKLIVAAARRRAPSLATAWPNFDPKIVRLVDRALAFSPEARWQTAGAMRQALASCFPERDSATEIIRRYVLKLNQSDVHEPSLPNIAESGTDSSHRPGFALPNLRETETDSTPHARSPRLPNLAETRRGPLEGSVDPTLRSRGDSIRGPIPLHRGAAVADLRETGVDSSESPSSERSPLEIHKTLVGSGEDDVAALRAAIAAAVLAADDDAAIRLMARLAAVRSRRS